VKETGKVRSHTVPGIICLKSGDSMDWESYILNTVIEDWMYMVSKIQEDRITHPQSNISLPSVKNPRSFHASRLMDTSCGTRDYLFEIRRQHGSGELHFKHGNRRLDVYGFKDPKRIESHIPSQIFLYPQLKILDLSMHLD
jgi:hypothetical protein